MLIIQIHKWVVQKEERLFLFEKCINQCKPHADHDTVNRSCTKIINFTCFALFIYPDGQIMFYKCVAMELPAISVFRNTSKLSKTSTFPVLIFESNTNSVIEKSFIAD